MSPRAEIDLSSRVQIGPRTKISSFAKIKPFGGPLTIGADVSVGTGSFIGSGPGGVTIGDDCLISPNVTILSSNYRHGRLNVPIRRQGLTSQGVHIGNNVWLGAGVVVLDGSTIGDGAIVAPNSLVSKGIPPNTVVQGSPAKVVFERR